MAFEFPSLRNLVRSWQCKGSEYIGDELIWSGQWPMNLRTGRKLCREELYQPPQARLLLYGGFHRYDLLADDLDQIRDDWLAPKWSLPLRSTKSLGVALSSEGSEGAGWPPGDCITELEIRRLHSLVRPVELVLIADNPEHHLIDRLADLSPQIQICSGWTQFITLRTFQKIAISQNAGHWWSAFLGSASEIYFPRLDRGPWSHPEPASVADVFSWHGIDLRVPTDQRYIYDW